jgi:hypothetical protein
VSRDYTPWKRPARLSNRPGSLRDPGASGTNRVPHLTTVRPVARGRLVPGAVVWAHVPFAEGDAEKTRPTVVKATVGRQVTILPASGAVSRFRFPTKYVELRDLHAAGLSWSTGVRRHEVTLDVIEIIAIVGQLSDFDMTAVLPSSCYREAARGGDAAGP